MENLFVRVAFSERENFIQYLSQSKLYYNKIVFVEGNDNDIPYEIWTHGKAFASTNTVTNVEPIVSKYINAGGDPEIPDYIEYYDEQMDEHIHNVWGTYNVDE